MKTGYIFTLTLICLMAVLSSCFRGEIRKKVLTDSLIKATENIAIGKARFGISESEFNQLFPDSLIELDGNKHNISSYFDSTGKLNSVYLIDLVTIDNRNFDGKLFKRMELIKRYFSDTYGPPQKDRGYPVKQKMLNGKLFEACKWRVGKKNISVGIALEETKVGNIYYVLSHVDRASTASH